jgi:flavin reductase (DIM6/NTAB) family NADH-FMN oxidoreductase RutF
LASDEVNLDRYQRRLSSSESRTADREDAARRDLVSWQSGNSIHETPEIDMHVKSESPILYFGTPVVLISTVNEAGTYNLAPMSSVFWLGWRCILGLAAVSKTPENMKRTGECVLNLPSVDIVEAVNRLARTTGSNPVPEVKLRRGYRFEPDKFGLSHLTPVASETVAAPRVQECPVQLEAKVVAIHGLAEDDLAQRGQRDIVEVRIVRVHLDESVLMNGDRNRIDPDKWRPLIMSFQQFYGLEPHQLHDSTLGQIPERLYRGPDIDRARAEGPTR